MSLEGVHDVEGGHGLSLGVLSVGDGVTNDGAEEALEDITDLLVDVEGDSLDTAASGESADRGLGDALDSGTGATALVTLDGNLSNAFATFATFSNAGHLLIL